MKNASEQTSEKRSALLVIQKFGSLSHAIGFSNEESTSIFGGSVEVYKVSFFISDRKGILETFKVLFPFIISKQNLLASAFAFIPVEERYQDWISALPNLKQYQDQKKMADIMSPFYKELRLSLSELVKFSTLFDVTKLIHLIMAIEEYQVSFKESCYLELNYLCHDLMKYCRELFDNFIVLILFFAHLYRKNKYQLFLDYQILLEVE
jgi:hypothetical protein